MNLVVSTTSPDRPLPARLASTLEWASAFLKRNRESIADLRRKAAAADEDVFTRGAGKLYKPLIEERERMESEIVRDVKLEASIFGWTVETLGDGQGGGNGVVDGRPRLQGEV